MARLFRRGPKPKNPASPRAIEAGAEEQRAAGRGLPTEITGLPMGTGDESPVGLEEALQCSAIAGALNVIAGRGCTLPLQRWRAETELPAGAFLAHPEADSEPPPYRHYLAHPRREGARRRGLLARSRARLFGVSSRRPATRPPTGRARNRVNPRAGIGDPRVANRRDRVFRARGTSRSRARTPAGGASARLERFARRPPTSAPRSTTRKNRCRRSFSRTRAGSTSQTTR